MTNTEKRIIKFLTALVAVSNPNPQERTLVCDCCFDDMCETHELEQLFNQLCEYIGFMREYKVKTKDEGLMKLMNRILWENDEYMDGKFEYSLHDIDISNRSGHIYVHEFCGEFEGHTTNTNNDFIIYISDVFKIVNMYDTVNQTLINLEKNALMSN